MTSSYGHMQRHDGRTPAEESDLSHTHTHTTAEESDLMHVYKQA